ncbi:uncharacterized protein CBO05P1_153 [Clostridium botulinum B str. Osaka05]|uniref:XkdX family protein n=1 Tax=Clostridium botulinum B str. Osaka05 TaxID=1407017 RepID=A0A060N4W9_CLOBO|nr:XkdX family protein [Clostridium botulinum]BAO04872.1 uncharacterized protein CBO05P1_153 [Clostridium botulinum B str. Osaka05]
MYNIVRDIYLEGKIDIETGLANAVKFGWITEEQKEEIIQSKIETI